ncbi:hypothetical protein [Polymorphobacter fuscus]|uniref:Uncharacterized protein n=1 Tax=Sandarakinorhabdus fusca TaxID=1439888 RepID=A0A7C9GMY5_9SPHN|nr:hypothetical protein [Polymorphobacter fuscus]KAB7648731.1 hypothetical protein F9290_03365 [Polymorphobacter fuscus]MQT16295.1 hypothetical protein [Polymorphobacter fuscus]NJC07419.1 type III secretory pathway component EscS [Polymorphobacter fuscus]
MNNIALLRRVSLAAMLVAVVTGTISLFLLFTRPTDNKLLFAISVIALLVGLLLDRRAGKLEDRNAG